MRARSENEDAGERRTGESEERGRRTGAAAGGEDEGAGWEERGAGAKDWGRGWGRMGTLVVVRAPADLQRVENA